VLPHVQDPPDYLIRWVYVLCVWPL
jgi:hypothetical protein